MTISNQLKIFSTLSNLSTNLCTSKSHNSIIKTQGTKMNNIMGFIKEKKPTKVSNNSLNVPKDFTHSCAIGQTGSGKTSCYIYPNLEQRIKDKGAILFFDYKGKEHQSVKYFAKQNGRFNDIIEIGKDWGKSINLLKYMSKGDLEDFIKSMLQKSV